MTTPNSQNAEPFFGIQRVYLQDVSFEMPKAPQIFLEQAGPNIDVNLEVSSSQLDQDVFHSVLRVTLTAKTDAKVFFLLEVEQAAVFEIRNIPAEQREQLLEINAPSILAPYARAAIADFLAKATLPVFTLPEINWVAMYQQKKEQQVAANDAGRVLH
jgi:preprotein translocase subunit SecB